MMIRTGANHGGRNFTESATGTEAGKFAADRNRKFTPAPERCPVLHSAWERSRSLLAAMRSALENGLDEDARAAVAMVAVAGSLGRMEATPQSDCDLIVILHDEPPPSSTAAERAYADVWKALAPLGLPRPTAEGIYAAPTTRQRLLVEAQPGKIDEDLATFGTRFQLLLDAQPVFGNEEFLRLRNSVVDWYASDYVAAAPHKEWSSLLNDLIRYFRSLCVTYQWGSLDAPPKWRLRNIKGRHSRLVMYAGLLFLLGESSREQTNKVQWLKERLSLTPLERIAWAYAEAGEPGFERIAECYETFLTAVGDPQLPVELAEEVATADLPAEIAARTVLPREQNARYLGLKQNADRLLRELLRFVLARTDHWSDRFLEYLLF